MLLIFWNRAEVSILYLTSRCDKSNFSVNISVSLKEYNVSLIKKERHY